MKPRRLAAALQTLMVAAVVALWAAPAGAAGGDAAGADRTSASVGERFVLVLEVHAPPGASVDLDSAADSWNGVEVVAVLDRSFDPDSETGVHRLELAAAGFVPDARSFSPAVLVTDGSLVESRELPEVRIHIVPTLAPGEPLLLAPLPDLESTSGEQSVFLIPAIVGAAVAGLIALLLFARLALGFGVRFWRARRSRRREPIPTPAAGAAIDVAGGLLSSDIAEAYRLIAQAVRADLLQRFSFPAPALTTVEIGERLTAAGADRWQTRLVSGLLEECDSVVYAGYRPAAERIDADLAMAREILEGAG